jgi:hypothetical protein
MRKLPVNIPLPERSDFVRTAAKANSGVRTVRSWLAKRIEPKQAATSKPKQAKQAKEKS